MREIARPDLSRLTTLHLGGRALAELRLEDMSDLEKMRERVASLGGMAVCIGRGSNILAREGELPIVLVRVKTDVKPHISHRLDDRIFVRVGAGVSMAGLLRFCLANELSGLEGLVGIPGTVGGAVAMNSGSFGCETGTCLHEVLGFGANGIKVYDSGMMHPGYRQMAFENEPETPIILEAIFALTKGAKNGICMCMHHNLIEKKSRQPLNAWSAGSAFKNPGNGVYAGQLLEAAGFRGKKYYGMAFSEKHANFLINEGKGSAPAALELLGQAAEAVHKKFGIWLEPEIRIIPWRQP